MLDATYTPADIKYPTDLGLLNQAREIPEDIIDVLHRPHVGAMEKPRTYCEKARKSYLSVSKQRRASGKAIRKIIEDLKELTPLKNLSKRYYRRLLIISELYRQQREMMEKKTTSSKNAS